MGNCCGTDNSAKYSEYQGDHHTFDPYEHQAKPVKLRRIIERIEKDDVSVKIDQLPAKRKRFQQFQEKNPGVPFRDEEFPPQQMSICKNIYEFTAAQNCVWRQAKEFLKAPIQVFSSSKNEPLEPAITPNDIEQGDLGDCYFLSSLAALAENPNLIRRLFETQTYQENGMYGVYMFKDGEAVQVILDDYFPVHNQTLQPLFSHPRGSEELWVLLLEKAYAKMYGSYEKIEAGFTGQSIRDLTGSPYEWKSCDPTTVKELWDWLVENDKKGFILTAGSQGQDDKQKSDKGIILGHAYSILDAQCMDQRYDGSWEVSPDRKSQSHRIIKLRNPWGQGEWRGEWSDGSAQWNHVSIKDKETLGYSNVNDGSFWMPFDEFIHEFGQIYINKLHEDYYYTSEKVDMRQTFRNDTYCIFPFELTKEGKANIVHAFLTVSQKNPRNFEKERPDYDISFARLIICEGSPQNPGRVVKDGATFHCKNDTVVEVKLPPGKYFAYAEVDWVQNYERQIIFNIYANNKGKIDNAMQPASQSDVLDQIFLKHQDNGKKHYFFQNQTDVFRTTETTAGYLYMTYTNASEKLKIRETIQFTQRSHICIYGEHESKDTVVTEVGPGHQKIVKIRVDLKNGKGAYNYKYSSKPEVEELY